MQFCYLGQILEDERGKQGVEDGLVALQPEQLGQLQLVCGQRPRLAAMSKGRIMLQNKREKAGQK